MEHSDLYENLKHESWAPTSAPTRSANLPFTFLDDPGDFPHAEAACKAIGLELATIHNAVEDAAARALCAAHDYKFTRCFIGLRGTYPNYYWTDGTPLDYGFDENVTPIGFNGLSCVCCFSWI